MSTIGRGDYGYLGGIRQACIGRTRKPSGPWLTGSRSRRLPHEALEQNWGPTATSGPSKAAVRVAKEKPLPRYGDASPLPRLRGVLLPPI